MKLSYRFKAWWLFDRTAEPGAKLMGPYRAKRKTDARREARDAMRGLQRYARYGDRRGFVTQEGVADK